MNKRQKIIISIVGITIVLLALLGITYAYYLTRIQGNTNTNSISVTTTKLELVYGDNSAEILTGSGALMPTVETDADDAIGTKTFTVTNNGNDSSYVVIIDNVETKYATNGSYKDENGNTITYTKDQETNFVTNDFRYTLACVVKDKSGNAISDETCNDVETLSVFPIKGGILVGNGIEENRVHEYTLTLWYIDNGQNQSIDMNKTYQARVNISDVNQMENPFKTGVTATDNASLAYNILNNAKENKNGTKLLNVADTPVATDIARYKAETTYSGTSWAYSTYDDFDMCDAPSATTCTSDMIGLYIGENCEDEPTAIITGCDASGKPIVSDYIDEYESSLVVEQDDLGTSYYYRGAVEDNYVTFAGMCWRIVRIAGDGSVKIVLEDQDEACSTSMNGNWGIPTTTGGTTYIGNYGYELKNVDSDSSNEYIMSYLKPVTNADKSMARAFYDFQKDKLEDYKSKLKSGNWCLADKAYTQSGSSPNYTYTLLEEYNYSSNMYYDSYVRLYGNSTKEPTLKCTGTIMDKFESVTYNETEIIEEAPMYVSALTADEMVYAGGKVYSTNGNFYLLNENFKSENAGYFENYFTFL